MDSTWLWCWKFDVSLTLWCPLLPYEYSNKASCAVPNRVKTSFCNFWHPGTLTLRPERQSARMSKITNDCLTRSGTGFFMATVAVGVKGLSEPCSLHWRDSTVWVKKKSPPRRPDIFSIFSQTVENLWSIFTHLLNVPIFARLQIFIQLSQIWTKLWNIKRDYPVHIICAKWPKRAQTRAFRRLRKSLIALLIVICGKSL